MGNTYSSGDLEGQWVIRGISVLENTKETKPESIPVFAEWTTGAIACSKGSYRGSLQYSTGRTEGISGGITVDVRGAVTFTKDDGTVVFNSGVMNAGKDTITAVYTVDGVHICLIFTKKKVEYTRDALIGTWALHEIESNSASSANSGWGYATLTVKTDLSYTGTLHKSDGTVKGITGTVRMDNKGNIILTSNDTYIIFSNGTMRADGNLVTATATSGEGKVSLITLVKKAAKYGPGDLTGSWQGYRFWISGMAPASGGCSMNLMVQKSRTSSSTHPSKKETSTGSPMSVDAEGRVTFQAAH